MWDTPFNESMLDDPSRNVIVLVQSEELAQEFVHLMYEHGVRWRGLNNVNNTSWREYKERTCYFVEGNELTYANKEYAAGEEGEDFPNHIKCTFYGVDTPDFETASDDELVALLGI